MTQNAYVTSRIPRRSSGDRSGVSVRIGLCVIFCVVAGAAAAEPPSCQAPINPRYFWYAAYTPDRPMRGWSDDPATWENAPRCTPETRTATGCGDGNVSHMFSDPVPAGTVLLLQTAGIPIASAAVSGDYMLEHVVYRDGGYSYVPMATSHSASTPALGWTSEWFPVLAGDRIAARKNTTSLMRLLLWGELWEAGCEVVLRARAQPAPALDLSAFKAALAAVGEAMVSAAQTVP